MKRIFLISIILLMVVSFASAGRVWYIVIDDTTTPQGTARLIGSMRVGTSTPTYEVLISSTAEILLNGGTYWMDISRQVGFTSYGGSASWTNDGGANWNYIRGSGFFVSVAGDTMTGNLVLDDGVTDSPQIEFINASNNSFKIRMGEARDNAELLSDGPIEFTVSDTVNEDFKMSKDGASSIFTIRVGAGGKAIIDVHTAPELNIDSHTIINGDLSTDVVRFLDGSVLDSTNVISGLADRAYATEQATGTLQAKRFFAFFIYPTGGDATMFANGIYINAANEVAYGTAVMPSDLTTITKINLFARSDQAELHGMRATIVIFAGAEGDPYDTEDVTITKTSETTNFGNTDILRWEFDSGDDADIGHIGANYWFRVGMVYAVADGDDFATKVYATGVEIEYE